ncbi:class I SAM-dependent methyltransferase, partial [Escherichia fergusonii]|uniref:class I SAM-dependent methyltransferase n=1 Tax=Escherichia fergusonii TaxID=564 RepID=UPI001CBDEBBD
MPVALRCDFHALPFPANSLDLVVLPHALELASDPHETLREVERVLVPEGRVVILGFNPASLWGLWQRAGR